ncbi:hypothetical protein BDN67DRAFT_641152 [Paxillus ammoniavirescens]|nr:hypothetical protein BDN67DRAFT_641152 [Paxillus ammoniavirescens]
MPLLSIEPDNDDYAKDLLLDKRVNDSLEGDLDETDETLKRTECITLLCAIVTCSDGVLDSEYTDRPSAGALIAKHPGLMDMLTAAWISKSYRDIRNLGASL